MYNSWYLYKLDNFALENPNSQELILGDIVLKWGTREGSIKFKTPFKTKCLTVVAT